jgi:hypothetical protein
MKKVMLPLAAFALVAMYAGTASAQCSFNIAPARGVKGSMVRDYAKCTGSTEHPASNTNTQTGTAACSPVTPAGSGPTLDQGSLYSYSPKGKCSVQTSAKLVSDCSLLTNSDGVLLNDGGSPQPIPAAPCHVTYVKSKCSGILGTDGVTPISASDDGWSLATLSRATLADQVGGDMTVIDFPVTFLYNTPDNGKISLSSSSAEALYNLINGVAAGLPSCTEIEVVDVTIKDKNGAPFARLGSATRP